MDLWGNIERQPPSCPCTKKYSKEHGPYGTCPCVQRTGQCPRMPTTPPVEVVAAPPTEEKVLDIPQSQCTCAGKIGRCPKKATPRPADPAPKDPAPAFAGGAACKCPGSHCTHKSVAGAEPADENAQPPETKTPRPSRTSLAPESKAAVDVQTAGNLRVAATAAAETAAAATQTLNEKTSEFLDKTPGRAKMREISASRSARINEVADSPLVHWPPDLDGLLHSTLNMEKPYWRSRSVSITIEASEYECSICCGALQEPKLLPCGHLLCRRCLVSLLESQQQASVCPLCLSQIAHGEGKVRTHKTNWQAVANDFPTDMAMVALVEADRILNKEQPCCMCERAAEASSLCLNCRDLFCDTCKKLHVKQKMARQHVVKDLSLLTVQQLAAHRATFCPTHADQPRDLFCESHNVPVCQACTLAEHCHCQGVVDLRHKSAESLVTLAVLAASLTQVEQELDPVLRRLDQRAKETVQKAKAALEQLQAISRRLQTAVNTWQGRTAEEIRGGCCDICMAVDEARTALLRHKGAILLHRQALQRTMDSKNRDIINTMTPHLSARVQDLAKSGELPERGKAMSTLKVDFDPVFVTLTEEQIARIAGVMVVAPDYVPPQPVETIAKKPQQVVKTDEDPQQADTLTFHPNHGKNILLSNHRQTAARKGNYDYGGVVMGCLPMMPNVLHQVRLDRTDRCDRNKLWVLPVGVVTQEPHAMTVPDSAYNCWAAAVGVWWKCIINNGHMKMGLKVGERLMDLPEGSQVGVLIDRARRLHLVIDGVDQGVAAAAVPDPCYPFFDVQGQYKQITALPLWKMDCNNIASPKDPEKSPAMCACPP